MINAEEVLICRIFEQAIEDYKVLKANKIEKYKSRDCCYSIKDIEKFFDSKWCEHLLELIDSGLTGKDILNKVQMQCA